MLAFVCISFLLCPLQLVEVKIKGFRTMEDPQMDSWFAQNLLNCLC